MVVISPPHGLLYIEYRKVHLHTKTYRKQLVLGRFPLKHLSHHFNSQISYDLHVFVDGRFGCNTCGKRFKYPTHFSTHRKWECMREPRFACQVPGCSYRVYQKSKLKPHYFNKHSGFIKDSL